jgi:HK97 family phage prohead protease
MELFHGTAIPDLEIRSSGDGRTIYGIAVPWNRAQVINESLNEAFEVGSFDHQLRAANRVWYAREHIKLGGRQIGIPQLFRNDAKGLYVELRTSKTPLGDETLELFRDGALRQLSIMFEPVQNRRVQVDSSEVNGWRGGTGSVPVISRVKANLREIALVLEGAYGDMAAAAGVRSAAGGTEPETGQFVTPNLDQARRILEEMKMRRR